MGQVQEKLLPPPPTATCGDQELVVKLAGIMDPPLLTGPSWSHSLQLTRQTPFGTSPSNPPYHAPDNNNDLFAAAPKPFFGDKQAAVETNPWTGVGTFTADMKPAHNPNNPFL